MQEYFILFGKVFGLLIVLFIGVMALFVYPTNILYKNEKIDPKWDTKKFFAGSIIFLVIITGLLYYFYHVSGNYMCNISKYFDCIDGKYSIGIYVLILIHLALIFAYNLFFINRLKDIIKSNKLDIYLFLFASSSIFLVLFNYEVYENIFSNMALVYWPVKILLYLVVYSPLYAYLTINYILKPKEKQKKKRVTKKK